MNLYLFLKFVHIVSSTILFGTGLGTACNLYLATKTNDVHLIANTARYVVMADWIFTTTSGFIQPVTGIWMMLLVGYSFMAPWLLWSIIGYLIAGFCWFPVVFFQIQMRNLAIAADKANTPLPAKFYTYFRWWFWLGWPAFISLIGVFYLMTNKHF